MIVVIKGDTWRLDMAHLSILSQSFCHLPKMGLAFYPPKEE